MSNFKRENRYVVIKGADIKYLDRIDTRNLEDIINKITYHRSREGRVNFESVVIESDWPEYEVVWKLLEERCNNDKISTN